jgi:hypothetical protein
MWGTPGITIEQGGYLEPGDFPGNHSLLWVDISYKNALGHNPPKPSPPQARRLQLGNTKCKEKYQKNYQLYARQHNLHRRQAALMKTVTYGQYPTAAQAREANAIDELCTKAMNRAKKRCRKLKMGGVGFSEATEHPKHVIAFWEVAMK